ncbi:MAG: hypothetical protein Q9181_007691, partial [Wetmoreana brouardii]
MASNATSSEQSSRYVPMTARRTDQEVDEYWKSVATPESIPVDLKILVREDLKEAWHFNRIDYVHRCVLRLEPDFNSEHFFANPVRITATGPPTVRGIIDAHRPLCLQASDLILQAGGQANRFVSYLPSGVSRHYSLFPFYRALVVITDHIWYEREPDGMISLGRVAQNQTVLIARTGTEADLSAPISFDSIKAQSLPIGVSNAIVPDVDVIRVSLATAMRFITDLERREKLANAHTMTTNHHDYYLDPPAPQGYEGDRQI